MPVTDGYGLVFDRKHGWQIGVVPPAWWLEMTDPACEADQPIPYQLTGKEAQPLDAA